MNSRLSDSFLMDVNENVLSVVYIFYLIWKKYCNRSAYKMYWVPEFCESRRSENHALRMAWRQGEH